MLPNKVNSLAHTLAGVFQICMCSLLIEGVVTHTTGSEQVEIQRHQLVPVPCSLIGFLGFLLLTVSLMAHVLPGTLSLHSAFLRFLGFRFRALGLMARAYFNQ